MDCHTFHKRLEDYLDGGLDFPGRFAMERHARQCFGCERDIAETLRLKQMVRDIRRVSAPADFETSLLARIRTDTSRHRFWRLQSLWWYGFENLSWRKVGVGAAAVILVAGITALVHFGNGFNRPIAMQNPEAGPSRAAVGESDNLQGPGPAIAARAVPPSRQAMLAEISPVAVDGSGFRVQDQWATPYLEPGDLDFFEYLVPVSGDRQLILQLPRTIRMRYAQPSREYYIRNVSH